MLQTDHRYARWLAGGGVLTLAGLLSLPVALRAGARTTTAVLSSAQLHAVARSEMLSVYRDGRQTLWAAGGQAEAAVVLQHGAHALVHVVYPLQQTPPAGGVRQVSGCSGDLSFPLSYTRQGWQAGPQRTAVSCIVRSWPAGVRPPGLGHAGSTTAYDLIIQRFTPALTTARIVQNGQGHAVSLQQGRVIWPLPCRGLQRVEMRDQQQRVRATVLFFHNDVSC